MLIRICHFPYFHSHLHLVLFKNFVVVSKEAGFAQEALAGLASKENFSKIELRKTDDSGTPTSTKRHEPFKNLMLLHIKGRRMVQIRLVEPSFASLNSGDCFILVMPDKVINWVGEFSNVIEKAKVKFENPNY